MDCPKCKSKMKKYLREYICYICDFSVVIFNDNNIQRVQVRHVDSSIVYYRSIILIINSHSGNSFKIKSIFSENEIDKCYGLMLKVYENSWLD